MTATVLAALIAVAAAGCTGGADPASDGGEPTDIAELSGTVYSVQENGQDTVLSSWTGKGALNEVLTAPDASMFTVSPDARYAAWLRTGGSLTHELMLADLSTGAQSVLYEYRIMGHSIQTEPVWSPDGRPMLLVQPEPLGDIFWHDVEADTQSNPIPVSGSWPVPAPRGGDGYDYYLWSHDSAALEVTEPSGDISLTGITAETASDVAGLSREIRGLTATNGDLACMKLSEADDSGSGLSAESTCDVTLDVTTGELLGVEHPRQQLFLTDGRVLSYYFDGGPDGGSNLVLADENLEPVATATAEADLGQVVAFVP